MELQLLDGELAVCRLAASDPTPSWIGEGAVEGGLLAITRTPEELSIVCLAGLVPDGVESTGPWRALRVAGTLEHSLTGVLSSLAAPLAEAGVPLFAISTFETDYTLVPGEGLEPAVEALEAAGHRVA